MLRPFFTRRFKKDIKKFEHNKKVKSEFDNVLRHLLNEAKLEEKYLDHPLTGNYEGCRECHLKPDVLLIYWSDGEILHLNRIGSHSELF